MPLHFVKDIQHCGSIDSGVINKGLARHIGGEVLRDQLSRPQAMAGKLHEHVVTTARGRSKNIVVGKFGEGWATKASSTAKRPATWQQCSAGGANRVESRAAEKAPAHPWTKSRISRT